MNLIKNGLWIDRQYPFLFLLTHSLKTPHSEKESEFFLPLETERGRSEKYGSVLKK